MRFLINKFFCYFIFLSITVGSVHSQTNVFFIDEVNKLIAKKDCGNADAYARNYFQSPLIYTILGMIQLDCKNNQKSAVEYFKMAARENETIALEMLIRVGDTSPETTSLLAKKNTRSFEEQLPPVMPQGPPPHILSTLPPPRQRIQTIIVPVPLQPPPMMFNPSACIQDGGGTYCPYYRR
jgi:hypothetical protein